MAVADALHFRRAHSCCCALHTLIFIGGPVEPQPLHRIEEALVSDMVHILEHTHVTPLGFLQDTITKGVCNLSTKSIS